MIQNVYSYIESILTNNENVVFLLGSGISLSRYPSVTKVYETVNDVLQDFKSEQVKEVSDILTNSADPDDNTSQIATFYRVLNDALNRDSIQGFKYIKELQEIVKTRRSNIRFEDLMGVFEDYIDPELELVKTLFEVKNENDLCFYHRYFQDIISRYPKAVIITTNLDNGLEYGCHKGNVIIHKEHFENTIDFSGKIIKLHGGIYRERSEQENHKGSEVVMPVITLNGLQKTGIAFEKEPYKHDALKNILNNSCLVVAGYSGSDDVDVNEFLLEGSVNLKKIYWINHGGNGDLNQISHIHRLFPKLKFTENHIISDFDSLNSAISQEGDEKLYVVNMRTENVFCVNDELNKNMVEDKTALNKRLDNFKEKVRSKINEKSDTDHIISGDICLRSNYYSRASKLFNFIKENSSSPFYRLRALKRLIEISFSGELALKTAKLCENYMDIFYAAIGDKEILKENELRKTKQDYLHVLYINLSSLDNIYGGKRIKNVLFIDGIKKVQQILLETFETRLSLSNAESKIKSLSYVKDYFSNAYDFYGENLIDNLINQIRNLKNRENKLILDTSICLQILNNIKRAWLIGMYKTIPGLLGNLVTAENNIKTKTFDTKYGDTKTYFGFSSLIWHFCNNSDGKCIFSDNILDKYHDDIENIIFQNIRIQLFEKIYLHEKSGSVEFKPNTPEYENYLKLFKDFADLCEKGKDLYYKEEQDKYNELKRIGYS
ncbi:MAG: hypothetical protein HQK92_00670 [Nitrospirae bacterium]|nr:hypothetical protein [Nitrospirota bacterium]